MPSGNFVLRVGSVADRDVNPGNWYAYNSTLVTYDSLDAAIVAVMASGNDSFTKQVITVENGVPPNPLDTSIGGHSNIRFNINTAAIVLTGDISGTYSLAGLPGGFQIDSATLMFYIDGRGGIARVTRNNSVVQTFNPSLGNNVSFDLSADLDLLSIVNDIYGIEVDTVAGWQPPITATLLTDATGTFISGTWSLAFTVSSITPDPAENETPITIDGTDLDTLTDFTIQYGAITLPFTPTTQTSTQIVFTLPDTGTYMGVVTIYSGSVPLGTLTIYVATGSGIYKIVADKRNDTQYDRETGLTTDVAIPEPFGETGFIGG